MSAPDTSISIELMPGMSGQRSRADSDMPRYRFSPSVKRTDRDSSRVSMMSVSPSTIWAYGAVVHSHTRPVVRFVAVTPSQGPSIVHSGHDGADPTFSRSSKTVPPSDVAVHPSHGINASHAVSASSQSVSVTPVPVTGKSIVVVVGTVDDQNGSGQRNTRSARVEVVSHHSIDGVKPPV